jgi:hypothetical protein
MRKIIILATGEIKDETNNVAFGLIDKGLAKLYVGYQTKPEVALTNEPLNVLRSRGNTSRRKRGYIAK